MNERIPMSTPDIGPEEEHAALRALRSGWAAPLGPEVDAFEAEIAQYTSRKYAVALSSGTAALHLALLNYGIGKDDVVVTSTMTFVATANAIRYTGAEPVFVDSDSTGNMDPAVLREALQSLQKEGVRPSAILPVDLLGKVANYEEIQRVGDEYEVPIISDAAESLGAWRGGIAAGGFGEIAAISFNGNKIMTTSGGGMLLTDDHVIADRARYLATQARQPVLHYEHTETGYNYRLSNILAAIGRAQLSRLDGMIDKRRKHRIRYRESVASLPGIDIFGGYDGSTVVMPTSDSLSGEVSSVTRDNFWLSSIVINEEHSGTSASKVIAQLAERNIESRPLWKPMHLQPAFIGARRFTNGWSEALFRSGISLPSGSALTQSQSDSVFDALSDALGG